MMALTDIYGYHSLERMAGAPRFNRWMYETISPFLSGRILEIGSGIGNLSNYFIEDGKSISLSDYDNDYVNLLKERYNGKKVDNIFELDLSARDFETRYNHLADNFHSIFLLNVLEHINDDKTAILNCRFLLKPGGCLLVLVPAYPVLFSKMDILLGHHRRYTMKALKKVISDNNFKIKKGFRFNALGICGWGWSKIFNLTEISKTKINLYNNLVPVAKFFDKMAFHSLGLSVIVIAKKKFD
jgi:SAM-dependent methyltransferase